MNQRRPHIRELDGIRAIAVSLVIITHLFGNIDIVPLHVIADFPLPIRLIVTHGWLGVDLFFVLSGFLITGILLDAKGKHDYYRGFYVRRVLRIFPLYFTVLIVLIGAYGYKEYAAYWNCALALSANLSQFFNARVPTAAGPMWSLAVEEQFYLFWPIVVLAFSRKALASIAIAVIVIEPFVRYALGTSQLLYPWARFDGLALGALLAIAFANATFNALRRLQLAAALAAISTLLIVATAPYGGFGEGAVSTAVRISEGTLFFGALVALVVARSGSKATSVFRSTGARIIADLSFCLYLVHVPIIEAFEFASHHVFPKIGALSPSVLVPSRALIVIVLSLIISAISRRYLEIPAQKLRAVLMPPGPRVLKRDASRIEPLTP